MDFEAISKLAVHARVIEAEGLSPYAVDELAASIESLVGVTAIRAHYESILDGKQLFIREGVTYSAQLVPMQ